jgi:two-component system phosphate regulon sensor histidine kinase PhoR
MGLFLLGLLTGFAVFWGYWFHREHVVLRQARELTADPWIKPFSSASRLVKTVANQQQATQVLRHELNTLQYLVHVAPIGFLQVDEENQLISCNVRACQLLNLDMSQAEKPRLLLEVVRSYELDALIEQTRLTQILCQSEWLFHPVDADFAVLARHQPVPLRGQGIPMQRGHIGVFLESREETVMLERQRDRWISDVAHELKTPLTSIRLVAETLQPRLESPARDWIERLLREAIRLGNLVQDLLDLNHLQAQPQARLSLKPVDFAKLVQSAWSGLEPLASEKRIQLDYAGAETLLIQADEARLHRVVLNLLDNSIKYSPTNQKIRVQLGMAQDPQNTHHEGVLLEVIDAGPGFPEDAIPSVFERFYRVDPSRTRAASGAPSTTAPTPARSYDQVPAQPQSSVPTLNSGNGLGLAIVQQIVEAHQGFVTASNHPETGGAWLKVWLPYTPPTA